MKLPEPEAMDASVERRIRMLRTAMGPEIAAALEDPEVVEVLLNPDGSLWVDRLGTGREATGAALMTEGLLFDALEERDSALFVVRRK